MENFLNSKEHNQPSYRGRGTYPRQHEHQKRRTLLPGRGGPLLDNTTDRSSATKFQNSDVDPNDVKSWDKKKLTAFIKAFHDSDETVLVFPPSLNGFQRSTIHDIASVFGYNHKSTGPKSSRIMTISKPKESSFVVGKSDQRSNGAENFPSLLSIKNSNDFAEAHQTLDDLYNDMVNNIKIECKKGKQDFRRNFIEPEPLLLDNRKAIYDENYRKLQSFRKELPAFRDGSKVVDTLRSNDVAIVCGETGSGKTTQIPQIIYESDIIDHNKTIICTQPRRISAISVANRVASELGETCGNTCGYVIRFESKISRATRIIYMTTGILLRRLQVDPELKSVGCVIVDEVHERDLDTDFCLLLLRDRLFAQQSSRNKLKVVIMSATIQIERLKEYFTCERPVQPIDFKGSLFPVKEYFLEDALLATGESLDLSVFTNEQAPTTASGGNDTYSQLHCAVFSKSIEEACPFSIIVKLIISCHKSSKNTFGSILVFLPGWAQITKVFSMLKSSSYFNELWILMLHSNLSNKEQHRVFQPTPKRYRKVVLSTNIAETSITIEDVVWVIDSCLSKDTSYNSSGNFSALKAVAIAKANGIQRRGRAGRCQSGVCYHLLPQAVYEKLPEFSPPQILRTSLEEICLQIKAIMPSQKCADVLARALDAPPRESVVHAVEFLCSIGAFLASNENLTPIGAALAQLPIHPLLGKMLFAAVCFGVLESIAIIAASLSVKSPFFVPAPSERLDAERALRSLDEGVLSDHFCVLNLYTNWVRSGRHAQYAYRKFADPNGLALLERTKKQLVNLILKSPLGRHSNKKNVSSAFRYNSNTALVRFVVLWSLHPRIATIEFRVNRTQFPSILCWDDSPAQFSSTSVLRKARRRDFGEKTFLVYFERIFIESSLTLSEATAVSPLEVSLCMRHLSICPLEQVPDVLLKERSKKFLPAFPFSLSSEQSEENNASEKKKKLSCLFFDEGKKIYVSPSETAYLIQRIRKCLDYYLVLAILKLRADVFPDELVQIISRLLGVPCGLHQSYNPIEQNQGNYYGEYANTPVLQEDESAENDQMEGEKRGFLCNQDGFGSREGDEIVEYDDEFIVVYDDEEDEVFLDGKAATNSVKASNDLLSLTENEISAARNMYGDLTILQQENIDDMVSKAAAEAKLRIDAAKAEAEEENRLAKEA